MALPKITLYTLGGTIASTALESASLGVAPQLDARDILASVPQLSDLANVEPIAFRQVPSGDLKFSDLFALASAIQETFNAGSDAVVITQGTDSMEETAFALDLLVSHGKPIVVTGAMRNPTQISPDGPGNLLAAVRVAISHAAVGLGVLVVMDDEIHAARFVRKTHTTSRAAFKSPTLGPLGWITEEEIRIPARLNPMEKMSPPPLNPIPKVALFTVALDDDGAMLGQIDGLGYRGLVIEAFGGGHVPSTLVDRIEKIAARIPVILASRTGSGESLRSTYGFPGAEIDLLSRGVVSAGFLDGPKARILLSFILSATPELSEAKNKFAMMIHTIG